MADENKVEAVLISPAVLTQGDKMDRARRIAAGLFGYKPNEGTVTFVNQLVDGMMFAKRSPQSPDYLFPTSHSLAKSPRYDWQPAMEDGKERKGILVGIPHEDPDAEPAG